MRNFYLALALLLGLCRADGAFAQFGIGGLTGHAPAPDQLLPAMGGPGGGQFFARCANFEVLHGLWLTTGDDVDSLRLMCFNPSASVKTGFTNPYQDRKYGGEGGSHGPANNLSCPPQAPAVIGMEVGYEGQQTVIINNIHLFCGKLGANQPLPSYPTVVFDGPALGQTEGGPLTPSQKLPLGHGMQTCPSGFVPVGINGRSGRWVDAIGLICGSPPAIFTNQPNSPVKSLGRVNTGQRPSGPPRTLCEAAADARARNSPAAANLEAQCKAHPDAVKTLGRVNTGPSAPRSPDSHTICDAARDALARQSPAAPNLVAQCRAQGGVANAVASNADLTTVSVRGEAAAANDEMLLQILTRVTDPNALRGFYIGLGIWGDQTAPGPGKQRYHDALIAPEQRGFELAAAYALPHNKYASLLAVGAAINAADPDVAAARAANQDGFFWLGFDIASGLFGDPAAGSQANKVVSVGTIEIRNSLNAPAQAGFTASMKLHLGRHYE
jgi:hypothetical protein